MRRRHPLRPLLPLAALVLCALSVSGQDENAKPLVRGTDPEQFKLVGIDSKTITISDDGEIRLTGKPNGYFATKEGYRNYILKFDWMYEKPDGYKEGDKFDGNSGLLVHIEGEHKVWPKCTEVQLANSDAGHIFAINGAKFAGKKDAAAQKKAIKPVGEWNSEVVTCHDGEITCTLNGIQVDHGDGAQPDAGPIGWQSEGSPIRFRNLRIIHLR